MTGAHSSPDPVARRAVVEEQEPSEESAPWAVQVIAGNPDAEELAAATVVLQAAAKAALPAVPTAGLRAWQGADGWAGDRMRTSKADFLR